MTWGRCFFPCASRPRCAPGWSVRKKARAFGPAGTGRRCRHWLPRTRPTLPTAPATTMRAWKWGWAEPLTAAGFALQCLQVREHHERMPLGIHRRVVLRDAAFRVDDEGLAARDFHQAERAAQHAVGLGGFLGAVRQQGEGQAMLLRKLLVRSDIIDADAEDHGAQFIERENVVAEFAGLRGAARRVVLRIEIQHHPLAAVVLEFMPRAGLVLQAKRGRGGTHL